ncbi:hypothetical protein ABPG75_011710 [Micractinium tetrahymenae]
MTARGAPGLLLPAALLLLLLAGASARLEDTERFTLQAGTAAASWRQQQQQQQAWQRRNPRQRQQAAELLQPHNREEQRHDHQGQAQQPQQQQQQHQGREQQQRQQEQGVLPPWRRRLAKSGGAGGACKGGLWEAAKAAPDLQVLVAVQQLTPLNFFSPFGKASHRDFTLLAPTDAAWAALFGGASKKQKRDLRDGLAALLLYHQVLSEGYSAAQMAAKYSLLTALGPAINEDSLFVDMDKYGGGYVASGRAPQNYANVLRETEACGSHMIVIDAVLLPFSRISALPHLATDDPINSSEWAQILQLIAASAPGAPAPAPAAAPAGAGAPSRPPAAEQGVPDPPFGIQEGDGDVDDGGPEDSPAAGAAPAPAVDALPPPPMPPGRLPDCADLAASGQLLTFNGTLAGCNGTATVEGSVITDGPMQTAVSDAGQVDPRTEQPPPTPPSAGCRRGSAGSATLLAAAAAAAACLVLLV